MVGASVHRRCAPAYKNGNPIRIERHQPSMKKPFTMHEMEKSRGLRIDKTSEKIEHPFSMSLFQSVKIAIGGRCASACICMNPPVFPFRVCMCMWYVNRSLIDG